MATRNGFDRDEAYSVFETLRPEHGQTLERLAVATYSLDLVALAALLLSISPDGEQELNSGPLTLLDALRDLGQKIHIVYQKSRLRAAKRHYGVLHMMDGMISEVDPTAKSSWHPKTYLAQYSHGKGATSWRLWIGSRNLTGGYDREAGILLTGSKGGSGSKLLGAGPALQAMFAPAKWPASVWAEIAAVRWQSPPGVAITRLHWRQQGGHDAFVNAERDGARTFVVSPFVDDAGIRALILSPKEKLRLVTTAPAASALSISGNMEVRVAAEPMLNDEIDLTDAGDGVGAETPPVVRGAGLHAKLILKRSSKRNRLWIGSANLTRRGMQGPNAEIMAEAVVSDEIADALERYWDTSQDFVVEAFDSELENLKKEERLLDDALMDIVGTEFEIVNGETETLLRIKSPLDAFLEKYTLQAWLFTTSDKTAEWGLGKKNVVLRDGPIPLSLQTYLVGFRSSSRSNSTVVREWAQMVRFPDFDPVARNIAARASYIQQNSRVREWMRQQLDGISREDTNTWYGEPRSDGNRSDIDHNNGLSLFTVENVLSAWARNPTALDRKSVV